MEPTAPPRALRGFGHISRKWDATHGVFAAKILPGEYYVTLHDEAVFTVLGSCISACVRDKVFGIGGMNHFMLPASSGDAGSWHAADTSAATRYGNFAMEHLINDILKAGGRRENLEVKLFGGGRILVTATTVGERNIRFALDYVRTEGLELATRDLGDVYPRKVIYFPTTGRVRVKKLRSLHTNTIAARETAYLSAIEEKPVEGEIELF
ncbi:chemoreceptor glutamine deamidase CheD [Endothiovibrio diazotrophicus]